MVEVRRNLFFYTKQGTLRYSENSPVKEECDHQVCNCTKAVAKRPEGNPDQKQQYISYQKQDKNYNYEVGLASTGCHFTLRWPGEVWDKEHRWSSKNHAYYWFNSSDRLQVEIIKPDYGSVNCFFAHLYLGNQVDISTLFNGHSPSRIVDLKTKKPDELWTHACGFGQEAQTSFHECAETAEWRAVYGVQKKIQEAARTYDQDFVSDVQTIRENVEKNALLLSDVEHLCTWFSWVTRRLDTTELFRCGDYCYRGSHKNF